MKRIISRYSLSYPEILTYMLQSTGYEPRTYLRWYYRIHDFRTVMYRRTLDKTLAARLLLLGFAVGMSLQSIIGIWLIVFGFSNQSITFAIVGVLLIVIYPYLWAHIIVIPLLIGKWLIITPKNKRLISQAEVIFRQHRGIKIAVVGSYGKTSMKELLKTVLSEGLRVAATPANRNVAISHADFAQKLKGDEEVVIVEYGEGGPGDISRFAKNTHPNVGVITGLAPAHLDYYPTLEAVANDLFSLQHYIKPDNLYVNEDAVATRKFIKNSFQTYSHSRVLGWKISDIKIDITGTRFVMKKGKKTLKLHSSLVGRHQVGPLAFVAAFAYEMGLSKKQIERGVSQTKPFKHRMEARSLHGAWILDDTYNGTIDGMKAGLALLSELKATRKIYVTPGLVDQGEEYERVHIELGETIAKTNPDLVVIMKNSSTNFICQGLTSGRFRGEIKIIDRPLEFYNNLEHFVAAGDIVLLQNDLPDNYN